LRNFFYIVLISCIAFACKKKKIDKAPTPVAFETPKGFPQPIYNFANNPLTKEGIALGKKLFYDGQLSKDGNVPCASCHQQFSAFATFDHDFSHGVNNTFTTRNAPALQNLAWYNSFHLDGGIANIEVQPLAPIEAPNEMGETLASVLQKLQADPSYPPMFKAAFGSEQITSEKMLKAITQFELTMVSANSVYDKVKDGKAVFNSFEQAGYQLFLQHCNSCHKEPLFTDNSFRNIGLPINFGLRDFGRMRITGLVQDSLKFKVPSLRNAAFSFPYFHDGRAKTLEEAIDHYRFGVVLDLQTDVLVRNTIPLTTLQRNQIVAFIKTLSDTSFTKNPALAP
jgi:cytochrome c peroxidase